MIGDPREFWPTETGHLHPWLAKNIGLLGKCMCMLGLRVNGREVRVGWQRLEADRLGRQQWIGGLRIDLTARDAEDRIVVIEAHYGEGDHKHFGQLLTYAHTVGACAAAWVVAGDDPVFSSTTNTSGCWRR